MNSIKTAEPPRIYIHIQINPLHGTSAIRLTEVLVFIDCTKISIYPSCSLSAKPIKNILAKHPMNSVLAFTLQSIHQDAYQTRKSDSVAKLKIFANS